MVKPTPYHEAICQEMEKLATIDKVIFLGQQVASEDFYDTLVEVPYHTRKEMPVAEEMQLGISIGMALEGWLPISIYQRIDFIPRAMDQISNHLNLISSLSRGLYNPKVIIRTTIGSTRPLDVGWQHKKDMSKLFWIACDFPVYIVKTPEEVHNAYNKAIKDVKSSLIIEYQDLYYSEE